jgi:hypothetical protein
MTTPPTEPTNPIEIPTPKHRGPSRSLVLVLISVATALWLPASMAATVLAMFSVMLFDAPGSTQALGTVTLAMAIWTFPPSCWLAILLSWAFFGQRNSQASLIAMGLPLLPIALGVFAWIWIDVMQRGQLALGGS